MDNKVQMTKNFYIVLFLINIFFHLTCLGKKNRELIDSKIISNGICSLQLNIYSVVRTDSPISIVYKEYLTWSSEFYFDKCKQITYTIDKWINPKQIYYNEEKDLLIAQSSLDDLGESNIQQIVVYKNFMKNGFKEEIVWNERGWSEYPEVLCHQPDSSFEKIAILSKDSYTENKIKNFRLSIWNFNSNISNSIELENLHDIGGDNNTLNWVDSNTVKIVGKEIVLKIQ